jgi:phage N-6-adenine-methyltransferase
MAPMPQQKPGKSKQNYATPPDFIDAVKSLLGIENFTIDLAADESNTKALVYYDEARDALAQDWARDLVPGWAWLNPPFGDIGPWARKCRDTVRKNHDVKIAFLVPASVGSNWYRDYIHGQAPVRALNGRLAFMPEKPSWLYPKDCMLVTFEHGKAPVFRVWSWRSDCFNESDGVKAPRASKPKRAANPSGMERQIAELSARIDAFAAKVGAR